MRGEAKRWQLLFVIEAKRKRHGYCALAALVDAFLAAAAALPFLR